MITINDLNCLTPECSDNNHFHWLKLWSVNWRRGEKTGSWTFCSRKKNPLIATGKVEADAVIIVPTYIGEWEKKLLITKEYRIPLGGYYYGFPAGLIEKGMTPEETAIKEMKEETGLDVVSVDKVSPPLFSSAGLTDESSIFVYVTVSGIPNNSGNEDTEDIEVLLLDKKELADLYNMRGKYKDARLSVKMWPILDIWLSK